MDRALLRAGDAGCVDRVPGSQACASWRGRCSRALMGAVAMDQFTWLTRSQPFPSAVGAQHGHMFAGLRRPGSRPAADAFSYRARSVGHICLELFGLC